MPDPTRDVTGAAAQPSEGFDDAQEFFAGPLTLPIRGKSYTLPEVDLELGLMLAQAAEGKKTKLDGMPTTVLYARLCGDVWQQMLDDKLPGAIMVRVGETALTDFTQGRDIAKLVWKYGVSPEALAAQKAANQQTARKQPTDRQPKKSTRSTRSPRSATGTATPSPASSSGTSSPTATKRAPAKRATPKAAR